MEYIDDIIHFLPIYNHFRVQVTLSIKRKKLVGKNSLEIGA